LDEVLSSSLVVFSSSHHDGVGFTVHRFNEGGIRAVLIDRVAATAPLRGRLAELERLRGLTRVVAALSWRLDAMSPRMEREWVRQLARAKAWPELRWLWDMVRPRVGDSNSRQDIGEAYQDPDWQDDTNQGPPVVESALLARFAQAAEELLDGRMLKQVAWAAPRSNRKDPWSGDVWGEIVKAAIRLRIPGIVFEAYNVVAAEYSPFKDRYFGSKSLRLAFSAVREEWPEHPLVPDLIKIRQGKHISDDDLANVLQTEWYRDLRLKDNRAPATEFTGAARLCARRLINAYADGGKTGLEAELDIVVPMLVFSSSGRQQMALAELFTQSTSFLLGVGAQGCRKVCHQAFDDSGVTALKDADDSLIFAWCRRTPRPMDGIFTELMTRLHCHGSEAEPINTNSKTGAVAALIVRNCSDGITGDFMRNDGLGYLRDLYREIWNKGFDRANAGMVRRLLYDCVDGVLGALDVEFSTVLIKKLHLEKNRLHRNYIQYIKQAHTINDLYVRSRIHALREGLSRLICIAEGSESASPSVGDLGNALRLALERCFPSNPAEKMFPDWLKPDVEFAPGLPEDLFVPIWRPDKLNEVVFELLNNAFNALDACDETNRMLRIAILQSPDCQSWEVRFRNQRGLDSPTKIGTREGRDCISTDIDLFVRNSQKTDTLDEPAWAEENLFETRLVIPAVQPSRVEHRNAKPNRTPNSHSSP
jgi:hypothetical protein